MSDTSEKYGKKMIILYPLLNEQNPQYQKIAMRVRMFFYPKQLGSINRILRGK